MTPKLICQNYRFKIGSAGEARVLGMTEYTNGERGAPGQYIAIIQARGKPPERFDTDSFENAVAMVAKAFDETEDAVLEALDASTSKGKRHSTAELFADRPPSRHSALVQWLKKIGNIFAPS